MPFELSDKQEKKFQEWSNKHTDSYTGAIGGRYTFSFTPTSIGTVVKVSDTISKEELDLSDYDEW